MFRNYNSDERVYIPLSNITNSAFLKIILKYSNSLLVDTTKNPILINLSGLQNIDKLEVLYELRNLIDYKLTNPYIEKVHEVNTIATNINQGLNTLKITVNCKNIGISKTMNYSDYVVFSYDTVNKVITHKIVQTISILNRQITFTNNDYLVSLPFLNYLCELNNNSDDIDFHFTEATINGNVVLCFKSVFNTSKITDKYYDILYNPPTGSGKPMVFTNDAKLC